MSLFLHVIDSTKRLRATSTADPVPWSHSGRMSLKPQRWIECHMMKKRKKKHTLEKNTLRVSEWRMVEDDSQAEKLSNRPWQWLGLGAVRRVGTCRTVVEEKALRPSGFSRRRCQRRFSGKPSERHWFLLVFAAASMTPFIILRFYIFKKHFTSFFSSWFQVFSSLWYCCEQSAWNPCGPVLVKYTQWASQDYCLSQHYSACRGAMVQMRWRQWKATQSSLLFTCQL